MNCFVTSGASHKNICTTLNVDIFACINFRGFMKMDNFACIKIRVFSTNDSLDYNDSNFHSVYIFADILETRIKRKYVQRENFYVDSICLQCPSAVHDYAERPDSSVIFLQWSPAM